MPGERPDRGSDPGDRRLRRTLTFIGLALAATVLVGGLGWALGGRLGGTSLNSGGAAASRGLGGPGGSGAAGPSSSGFEVTPEPTPRPPIGGTELVGYLPYWQLNNGMLDYLVQVPVTTLELFSLTSRANGSLETTTTAYKRITGRLGKRAIAEAQARGARVELVFSSFGENRNGHLFRDPAVWTRAAAQLVSLARRLGADGLNVDVELIAGDDFEGYTEFLGLLRTGLDADGPARTLSVATMANHAGAVLARAAIAARVDRVFLMGYEYHWSGSQAGASAPIDRVDGEKDLQWSIAEYVTTGVPRSRIVLGLPLYGMSWPIDGPDATIAATTGKGTTWIPTNHLAKLLDPAFLPTLDGFQVGEYFVEADGPGWRATFYDSPRTLRPKLALARDQGLAGAGFWALGYERGLPGYLELMRDFRAGRVER